MAVREDLDPSDMRKPKAGRLPAYSHQQLLAGIADTTANNPISVRAWADRLGMLRQTLANYLPDLRAKGLLATVGEGQNARQYLTSKGRDTLGGT